MQVRIKQTTACRAQLRRNAGASDPYNPTHRGYPGKLRAYRRAGIEVPETWSAPVDVDTIQLEALRADPHVELEEITAAAAAETDHP